MADIPLACIDPNHMITCIQTFFQIRQYHHLSVLLLKD